MLRAILCLGLASHALALAPTGLLCEFQKSPALGVRENPHFTWIVPPCAGGADHQQQTYQLVISSGGKTIWDSGKVTSSDSTYAPGPKEGLKAGTAYEWTVTTWTVPKSGGAPCQSEASAPATLITALFDGWNTNSAQFLGLKGAPKNTFGYFRKEIAVPAGVTRATAYVTAPNTDPLLSGYKLYFNGKLVNLGAGRGEAPVWDGDGQFRRLPYTTLDVTKHLTTAGPVAIALETMHSGGCGTGCSIMLLKLTLKDGTTTTFSTDGTWQGFNGDAHRKPGAAKHGHSAGTGCVLSTRQYSRWAPVFESCLVCLISPLSVACFVPFLLFLSRFCSFLEYIDARAEPVGWMTPGFKAGAGWDAATGTAPSAGEWIRLKRGTYCISRGSSLTNSHI
jgi:hypothetical protein